MSHVVGIYLRARKWLDYQITPISREVWPNDIPELPHQWLCHITRTLAQFSFDEIRVHENAATIPDYVVAQSNLEISEDFGDPAYGELPKFTYDKGKYHLTDASYLRISGGWNNGYMHPLVPGNAPNGDYTITIKARYRTTTQTYDMMLPIEGASTIDGKGPPADIYSDPLSEGWSAVNINAVSTPWKDVTSPMSVTLQNLVITQTTPGNPQPILWDPATMTHFPLQISAKAAYRSQREVTAQIINTAGTVVTTLKQKVYRAVGHR